MFQLIPLAVALIGSSIAAAWDLRTTEIPDEIPYAMIFIALGFYGIQSVLAWNYWFIINSMIAGLALFSFGFVMYYFGQWGGGDAKLVAAIGFLLPTAIGLSGWGLNLVFPFPVSYIFNVFFVGAGYMMVYALVLAVQNRKIFSEFKRDMKASSNIFLIASTALFVALIGVNWFVNTKFHIPLSITSILINSIIPVFAAVCVFTIWKFARAVENVGFKKKIPVSKLRIGDVLMSSKLWEGITEKELRKIKRSGKRHIWIKEGVRFGPAFPLALLFTIYFGDAIFFLFRFLG